MKTKIVISHFEGPRTAGYLSYNTLEMFYYGISLAFFKANEHYKNIEFIGNVDAWKLIEKLNLPWSKVHVLHPGIDYDETLLEHFWNYGKLVAMKIAEPPYIHIDTDVFLLKDCLPEFTDFLFQNPEHGVYQYDEVVDLVYNDTKFKSILPEYFYKNNNIENAYNCGVIGIGNKEVRDEWLDPLFVFLDKLKEVYVEHENIDYKAISWPIFIEQYSVYCYVKSSGVNVALLSNSMIDMYRAAEKLGYVHLLSNSKRLPRNEERIRARLLKEYPEQVKLISKL